MIPLIYCWFSYRDRPRRSVLRCSVIFYICHGFDGNRSAQCIFASMFRHSDVRLHHQISGTKGLNQCVKCPVFPSRCPPPSSNLGDEMVKSMHDLSVSLVCHQMMVSHANGVNATFLYCDCGISYKCPFKTFSQRWLNAPNV